MLRNWYYTKVGFQHSFAGNDGPQCNPKVFIHEYERRLIDTRDSAQSRTLFARPQEHTGYVPYKYFFGRAQIFGANGMLARFRCRFAAPACVTKYFPRSVLRGDGGNNDHRMTRDVTIGITLLAHRSRQCKRVEQQPEQRHDDCSSLKQIPLYWPATYRGTSRATLIDGNNPELPRLFFEQGANCSGSPPP